ncbi:MAG: nucleoprotein [Desulfurococcales archaeon]|nr:nucleoprotein [Desulfurococcales archaeon]
MEGEQYGWVEKHLSTRPSVVGVYSALLAFRVAYVKRLYVRDTIDIDAMIDAVLDDVKLSVPRFTGRPLEAIEAGGRFLRDLIADLGATDSLEEAKFALEEIELRYIDRFNEPLRRYADRLVRSLDPGEADILSRILLSIKRREIIGEYTAAGSALIYMPGLSLNAYSIAGIDPLDLEDMFSCMVLARVGEDAAVPSYFFSREFEKKLSIHQGE